jgi:hypothetical protein
VRLPQPRTGEPVTVRGRAVDFSLWPVRRTRSAALNPRLFVSDPWPVITQVARGLRHKAGRQAGLAYLEQARDFFHAASAANTAAAKPLLLYYSFLNVAKTLILVRMPGTALDSAKHGLAERLRVGGRELLDAYLEAKPTGNKPEIFDLLLKAIRGNGLTAQTDFDVPALMRQVVTGHRLYLGATGKATESFLAPRRIEILHDSDTRRIWLRMAIASGDLARLGVGQQRLLQATTLAPNWHAVSPPTNAEPNCVWLEMTSTKQYQQGWIADKIMPVIEDVRNRLWQTVLSVPPYRAYYLYLPPVAELASVLPQILSSYALFFYFGSITRYRPHHFDRILAGPLGAFTESLLNDQPSQLLFLLASEFARRDVAKAAIV